MCGKSTGTSIVGSNALDGARVARFNGTVPNPFFLIHVSSSVSPQRTFGF